MSKQSTTTTIKTLVVDFPCWGDADCGCDECTAGYEATLRECTVEAAKVGVVLPSDGVVGLAPLPSADELPVGLCRVEEDIDDSCTCAIAPARHHHTCPRCSSANRSYVDPMVLIR